MSAIAGWAGGPRTATSSAAGQVESLLARMPGRGGERRDVWKDERVALGVARFAWEDELTSTEGDGVARGETVTLVADATLYDTGSLLRDLASVGKSPPSTDVRALMLAAYRAWGASFPLRLNGDFAFIVWDGERKELVVGRDFVGRRSLFIRDLPGGDVAVASQSTPLAHGLGARPDINRDFIAAAVAGLLSGSRESAYAGVSPAPAGSVLRWTPAKGWSEAARWEPPPFATRGKGDFREGAIELRRLLTQAVAERCTSKHVAIYLSGGADSPAVFGAAGAARERGAIDSAIHPISVSFPEGDSARENTHIEAVVQHWSAVPTWIDSETMELFDRDQERAAIRDDPYAHTFEQMNRYLGAAARSAGARVALDGHGGDLLFQVSDVAIAELLLVGDLRGWRRLLSDGGYKSWREVLRWGVAPALPNVMWRTVDAFRGRALQRPFEQDLAPWLAPAAKATLTSKGWTTAELRRRLFEGPAAYESRWYLTAPYMSRAISWTHEVATQMGLELRSPLLDRRVVEFAAGRPVTERASVRETKRLLREAVRGLVPDSVLAPRSYKTGVPRGYLGRQMARGFCAAADRVFGVMNRPGTTILLAELGVIDPSALNYARTGYENSRDHLTGVQLFLTLEAELWLRTHGG